MSKVAMAVDLDMCTGCFACQNACKMVNDLPAGEHLLFVQAQYAQPKEYQGKLYLDRYPQPVTLEACAACPDRQDGGQPVCATVCMGRALMVGERADVFEWTGDKRVVIFA